MNSISRSAQRAIITGAALTLTAAGYAALTSSAVGAGQAPDAAQGASTKVCVDLGNHRFVNGHGPDHLDVPLPGGEWPAGEYIVDLDAHDGYEGRANTDPSSQTSERIEVAGIVTPDLQDGVDQADAHAHGTVTFAHPFTTVTVNHHHADGADSVQAVRVCLTPRPVTPPSTTVPSTTEAPTTQPPTTEAPSSTLNEAPTTVQPATTVPVSTSTTQRSTTTRLILNG